MAVFVLKNAWVRIAGIDVTDHITEVEVAMTAEEADFTAMGAGGRQRAQGLRDDSFTFTANSDFAANSIDALIYPIFDAGSTVLVEVAAVGGTISATNPKFSGSCILLEYTPIGGGLGDVAQTPLTLPVNGKITRGTA